MRCFSSGFLLLAAVCIPLYAATPGLVSVSPSSGSGLNPTFTFTISDSAGFQDIKGVNVLINSSFSGTNACWLFLDISSTRNTITLASDDASTWISTTTNVTPGNSQCIFSRNGFTVSGSGNTLTWTIALNFFSGFAGAKTVYLRAVDQAGNDSGYRGMSSWTVGSATATPDFSVTATPSSQTIAPGASASYTLAIAALNGFSGQAGYYATVSPSGPTVTFSPDTVAVNNNTVNVTMNVATTAAMSQTTTITATVFSGNLQHMATVTLNFSGGAPAIAISPSSGSGASQTFAVAASDPLGFSDLRFFNVLFSSGVSGSNACWLYFQPSGANQGTLYLASNDTSFWTPSTGAGTLSNSQCSASGFSVSGSGSTLTLNLPLSFGAAWAGTTKNVYLRLVNNTGADTGYQLAGQWTIPSGGGGGAPQAPTVSVNPASGSGSSQVFSFVASDTQGAGAISGMNLLINSAFTGSNGCWIFFDSASRLYLASDDVSTWSPLDLGSAATVGNSQCSVSGAGSSRTASGNDLTVNIAVTFRPAFAGAKSIFLRAFDSSTGLDSGYQSRGSWTVF